MLAMMAFHQIHCARIIAKPNRSGTSQYEMDRFLEVQRQCRQSPTRPPETVSRGRRPNPRDFLDLVKTTCSHRNRCYSKKAEVTKEGVTRVTSPIIVVLLQDLLPEINTLSNTPLQVLIETPRTVVVRHDGFWNIPEFGFTRPSKNELHLFPNHD